MKRNFQAGDSILEGIVILATIILIMVLLPKEGSPLGTDPGSFNSGWSSESNSNNSYVSLGTGNAAYAYQPYEEYITIENRGNSSVNITGWQLKNGKDKREYTQGGTLQRFSADIALIPQATLSLSPSGNNTLTNVVLQQGERAIITTGNIAVRIPYVITSFKENMCTGYIEALPDYAFSPALSRKCPNPTLEPGFNNLNKECRDAISSFGVCETPQIGGKDRDGENCPNCVNGRQVSSSCKAFVEERFNYQGCVANHSSNPEYSGRTWRIFLGRGWEMWANDYETIELFNSLGQLVDSKNY